MLSFEVGFASNQELVLPELFSVKNSLPSSTFNQIELLVQEPSFFERAAKLRFHQQHRVALVDFVEVELLQKLQRFLAHLFFYWLTFELKITWQHYPFQCHAAATRPKVHAEVAVGSCVVVIAELGFSEVRPRNQTCHP